jgi:hypothetical protein
MNAAAQHETGLVPNHRDPRQPLRATDLESRLPRSIHRRSRLNPVVIIAAFSAVLLFDAVSSTTARSSFHRLWGELMSSRSGAQDFVVPLHSAHPEPGRH